MFNNNVNTFTQPVKYSPNDVSLLHTILTAQGATPGDLQAFLTAHPGILRPEQSALNSNGFTPLTVTLCKKLNGVFAQILLANGADINEKDGTLWTALHHACMNAQTESMRFLLQNGASVTAVDSFGSTPLHCACYSGDLEAVKMLVAAGAPLNATCSQGWTPLHYASMKDRTEVVRWLVNRDEEIGMDKRNAEGKLPIEMAKSGSETADEIDTAMLTSSIGSFQI